MPTLAADFLSVSVVPQFMRRTFLCHKYTLHFHNTYTRVWPEIDYLVSQLQETLLVITILWTRYCFTYSIAIFHSYIKLDGLLFRSNYISVHIYFYQFSDDATFQLVQ